MFHFVHCVSLYCVQFCVSMTNNSTQLKQKIKREKTDAKTNEQMLTKVNKCTYNFIVCFVFVVVV